MEVPPCRNIGYRACVPRRDLDLCIKIENGSAQCIMTGYSSRQCFKMGYSSAQ